MKKLIINISVSVMSAVVATLVMWGWVTLMNLAAKTGSNLLMVGSYMGPVAFIACMIALWVRE